MSLFFASKKRLYVPRCMAVAMNVLNLLAPVLLGLAVALIGSTKIGSCPPALRPVAMRWGAYLVLAALAVRLVWAAGIRLARRRREPLEDR